MVSSSSVPHHFCPRLHDHDDSTNNVCLLATRTELICRKLRRRNTKDENSRPRPSYQIVCMVGQGQGLSRLSEIVV